MGAEPSDQTLGEAVGDVLHDQDGQRVVGRERAQDALERRRSAGRSPSAFERQRLAEQKIKTIYVHAHMDEDTYEIGRAMRCPDQVPVHAERLVGACNYNLFYRRKDPRFWVEP